jgi:hypothetical protein
MQSFSILTLIKYGIVVQDIRGSVARTAGAGYWECGYANKLT